MCFHFPSPSREMLIVAADVFFRGNKIRGALEVRGDRAQSDKAIKEREIEI